MTALVPTTGQYAHHTHDDIGFWGLLFVTIGLRMLWPNKYLCVCVCVGGGMEFSVICAGKLRCVGVEQRIQTALSVEILCHKT
jgi:hypothetical protein